MINFKLLSKSEIKNQIHHLDVQLAALQSKELKLISEQDSITSVLTRRLLNEHLELCPEPAIRLLESRGSEIAQARVEHNDLIQKIKDAGADVEHLQADHASLIHKARERRLAQFSAVNSDIERCEAELAIADADIRAIRSEVEGKLIGYNEHGVFVHLKQRNFGQPDQVGNWITKPIDALLSKTYGYPAMRKNFDQLEQIGLEIQQKQQKYLLSLVEMQKKQAALEQELLTDPECQRVSEKLERANVRRDSLTEKFRLVVERLSDFENQDDGIFLRAFSLTQSNLLNQEQSSIEFLEEKAPTMTAYFSDLINIQKTLSQCTTDKQSLQKQRTEAQVELSERRDSHELPERKNVQRNQSRESSVSDLLLASALVYSAASSADDVRRSSDDSISDPSDNSPGGSDFSTTDNF